MATAAIVATPLFLSAQGVSTAGMRGRVVDGTGVPIDGALVTLEHTATGATSTAVTTSAGRYSLRNQRPGGPYRITIAHLGFETFTRTDLRLLLGQYTELDVTLASRAVEIEGLLVEVEHDPQFNRGRIGISTLITSEVIEELPTLTRDFVDFAALSPLATVSEEGVSVAGTNYRFNTVSVDGALNQDVFGLSTQNVAGGRAGSRVIPLEAVEQFQVLVAPFDIRQSGFTGAALVAATRSGTNEFEASAFGFHRGKALVGELVIDDVSTSPDLSTAHGGFTIGGPIARDRAHFFVAAEWERIREPPTGFHVGVSDPLRLALLPDSVARMQSLLQGLGADPGIASPPTLENTVANFFVRFDWEIGDRHDAMFRYSFAAADDDPDPNRLPGDLYEFSSAGTEIRSRNHSAVFQLFSSFGRGLANELAANIQFLDDSEAARAAFPQVEVILDGKVDDVFVTRGVRAGANVFAQHNGLRQLVLQLADNLSYDVGRHQLLFGASATWFDFDRQFVPGALGSYRFESLEDLARNRASRYEVTIPLTQDGSNPTFGVGELAAYAQDEWAVTDVLTLRGGVRMDLPVFSGRPGDNDMLQDAFGIRTSRLPGTRPNLSARAGLNWRPAAGTQLRAGIGVFNGRPAFSWLANAFQNNGLATRTLVCRNGETPAFDPSRPAPTACAGMSGSGELTPVVNYFDPDFRFPQDLRTLVAIDQRLPGGMVLSASWIQNRALRQISIQDDNLGPRSTRGTPADGFTHGFGFGVRDVFGTSTPGSGTGPGMELLWQGGREYEALGPTLRVGNGSGNDTYAATAELSKDFGDIAGIRAGYSFTRSADFQDLLSIDVTSNFAATPVDRNPNNPARQRSRFDRPHKVVASAHARIPPRWGGTRVSVLYVGQSGVPYSYVYEGDVNGDGFPGPRGSTLANDLLFIPESPSRFPGSIANQILWASLFEAKDCLQSQATRILARNTCETPWSNRLDLRVLHEVSARGFSAEVTADLLNVLNFLNPAWGTVQIANPVVQLYRVRRHALDSVLPGQGGNELRAHYVGPLRRDPRTGRIAAALPFAPEVPTSQWRARFGLRVRLGR